jgi:uncharacterized protein (DUF58 family)
MTRTATPRLLAYTLIAAAFLLGALALQRPELVALAAPFALFLAVGLLMSHAPGTVRAHVTVTPESCVEGDPVTLTLDLESSTDIPAMELGVPVPDGIDASSGGSRIVTGISGGVPEQVRLTLRARHWGLFALGTVATRVYDPLHLFRFGGTVGANKTVRVFPSRETMRTLMAPARTLALAGSRVSRQKGDGFEFADLRAFGPGDRLRSINWRASARRGDLWVNERHPERNVDVVLFLDTFTHATSVEGSTLDEMIRGGAGLAAAWLGAHDRVGVVGFGGVLQWLEAGSGVRHAYRVVDALMNTQVVFSYAWKGIDVIPSRLLPPSALLVALTPMLDERVIAALLDLKARGFDVVVIELVPDAFVPGPATQTATVARRLWTLEREALRFRYSRAGVPVVRWTVGTPLEGVVMEVEAWRRRRQLRAG